MLGPGVILVLAALLLVGVGERHVGATSAPEPALRVVVEGAGSVEIVPASTDCDRTGCHYPRGAVVRLRAVPEARRARLVRWDRPNCGARPVCVVKLRRAAEVTATFTPVRLAVWTFGLPVVDATFTLSGLQLSLPHVRCGAATSCTWELDYGTDVVLQFARHPWSTFSGCTEGSAGRCAVSMTRDRAVVAALPWRPGPRPGVRSAEAIKVEAPLRVSTLGNGSGTVRSSPSGIQCGSSCEEHYEFGTPVTLEADAADGSRFAGWSGACRRAKQCSVTIVTPAIRVGATFRRQKAK